MRYLLVAFGLIASTWGAVAAELELPTLRGAADAFVPAPPVVTWRWDGFYFGGQVGYGVTNVNVARSNADVVADILQRLTLGSQLSASSWRTEGSSDTHGTSYGAFVGYNIGWEGVITGLELNYNRANILASASSAPITVTNVTGSDGNTYNATLSTATSMRITDIAQLRVRAGFEYGNFLPYAMIGVTAARAELARTVTATGQQNPTPPPDPNACDPVATPPCVPFVLTQGVTKSDAFIYGWAIGGGLEMMVMPNVFLRGEYEYVGFAPAWGIKTGVNTARLGLGFRFW